MPIAPPPPGYATADLRDDDDINRQLRFIYSSASNSDGVEYSTSEYEYRKKLRVRVLILKNVLEYEYRKKIRVRVLLQV